MIVIMIELRDGFKLYDFQLQIWSLAQYDLSLLKLFYLADKY